MKNANIWHIVLFSIQTKHTIWQLEVMPTRTEILTNSSKAGGRDRLNI